MAPDDLTGGCIRCGGTLTVFIDDESYPVSSSFSSSSSSIEVRGGSGDVPKSPAPLLVPSIEVPIDQVCLVFMEPGSWGRFKDLQSDSFQWALACSVTEGPSQRQFRDIGKTRGDLLGRGLLARRQSQKEEEVDAI